MIWLQMFIEFCETGLFAVGGGLATLPFLYAISARTGWFTTADIANMIAISESTPGPLGVNMATYVGYQTAGILGGAFATISLTFPSYVTVALIYSAMQKFKESKLVDGIFYGLRPASTALIAAAGLGVAKIALLHVDVYQATGELASLFDWKSIILAAVIFGLLNKFRWHPVLYIAMAAVAGIAFGM